MSIIEAGDRIVSQTAEADPDGPVFAAPPRSPLPPPAPSSAPTPNPRNTLRAALAGGVVGALVAGAVAFGTVKATDHTTVTTRTVAAALSSPSGQAAPSIDVKAVLAKVAPSVVSIEIGQNGRNGAVTAVAAGSGVVISSDGMVLTNAHVVALTDSQGRPLSNPVITVKTSDGKSHTAKVLGSDVGNDVAVIKMDNTAGLTAVTLGDSKALQVGDPVVAIGNALDLGDTPTVTDGIVSALGRSLDVDANVTLKNLIQTNAAINHGNSGGAIVNAAGELVGITSAGIPDAQNIGFAIPTENITPLLKDLEAGKSTATAQVAFLGVSTADSTSGVQVTGVNAGSAASAAGIKVGDVITKIGNKDIATVSDLGTAIKALSPGNTVTIAIDRNGTTTNVQATLGARAG